MYYVVIVIYVLGCALLWLRHHGKYVNKNLRPGTLRIVIWNNMWNCSIFWQSGGNAGRLPQLHRLNVWTGQFGGDLPKPQQDLLPGQHYREQRTYCHSNISRSHRGNTVSCIKVLQLNSTWDCCDISIIGLLRTGFDWSPWWNWLPTCTEMRPWGENWCWPCQHISWRTSRQMREFGTSSVRLTFI